MFRPHLNEKAFATDGQKIINTQTVRGYTNEYASSSWLYFYDLIPIIYSTANDRYSAETTTIEDKLSEKTTVWEDFELG